jgi:hypothetical protein
MRAVSTLFGCLFIAVSAPVWISGCDEGGVGDPCLPEDEFYSDFSGYSRSEVNFESGSLQCRTRTCLVNHFQGRVSCPFGQDDAALDLPANDPRRCRLPGTSGEDPSDAVSVPVDPWKVDRTPDAAVYCSCRCAGPDKSARYCECPSGFVCEELVKEFGVQRRELAGSYCVKQGTEFEPSRAGNTSCSDTPNDPRCSSESLNP